MAVNMRNLWKSVSANGSADVGTAPPPKPVPQPPPADPKILGLQKALKRFGYDPGDIDGIMGDNTRAALKKYQKDKGVPPSGTLDAKTQGVLLTQLAAQNQADLSVTMVKGTSAAAADLAEKQKAETARQKAAAAAKAEADKRAIEQANAKAMAAAKVLGVGDPAVAPHAPITKLDEQQAQAAAMAVGQRFSSGPVPALAQANVGGAVLGGASASGQADDEGSALLAAAKAEKAKEEAQQRYIQDQEQKIKSGDYANVDPRVVAAMATRNMKPTLMDKAKSYASDVGDAMSAPVQALIDTPGAVDAVKAGVDYGKDKGVIPDVVADTVSTPLEAAQGLRERAGEKARDNIKGIYNPTQMVDAGQQMYYTYKKGKEEEGGSTWKGVRDAANVNNPVYQGLVHGHQAYEALKNGDVKEGAKRALDAGNDAGDLINIAAGGVAVKRAVVGSKAPTGAGAAGGQELPGGNRPALPPGEAAAAGGEAGVDPMGKTLDPMGKTQPASGGGQQPHGSSPPPADPWAGTVRGPASAGDGLIVEVRDAIETYRSNPDLIRASAGPQALDSIWQSIERPPNTPVPPRPPAFRYGNRIWVDMAQLTAEQRNALGVGPRVNPMEPPDHTPLRRRRPPDNEPPGNNAPQGGGTGGTPMVLQRVTTAVGIDNLKLVQKYAANGGKVYPSVTSAAHLEGWEAAGGKGPVPIAYQMDRAIHVDLSRWPKDMAPPDARPPAGGVNPRSWPYETE